MGIDKRHFKIDYTREIRATLRLVNGKDLLVNGISSQIEAARVRYVNANGTASPWSILRVGSELINPSLRAV